MKTMLCTILALIAFAGNSILCRLALGERAIDAASFTSIRLLSGIVMLVVILKLVQGEKSTRSTGSWKASLFLFFYAATFSFAYVSLETGVGALILFASVQITMILVGILSGNKLQRVEWCGVFIAFSGFVYLVMPSLATPSLMGFILMSISGIAWGLYSLNGKGAKDPLSDTAYNFIRTLPFVIVLSAIAFQDASLSQHGVFLAILSGAITSGAGYTIWYIALKGLSVAQAAVVQLLVPVIAAIGGVLFANELMSFRLILSFIVILGGILTVILGKYYLEKSVSEKHNKRVN